MYELIIHFFRVRIEEDASPSRRGELQVILYSINLPLSRSTEKLQTTVSCYTSTDHHHLMHTISTTPVVRCLEWRAHVIIFRCFSNRHQPTLTLRRRRLPIPLPTHISFRTIIIIVITSARGHHHSGLSSLHGHKTDISDSDCGITNSSGLRVFSSSLGGFFLSFLRSAGWWCSCLWCAAGGATEEGGRGRATDEYRMSVF